jgi:glycosyltransferase involved in cell wall biosynthesis
MMNEPQVSFITVCYNGFKDTCELIESLQTHVHSVSYEIIVVDNASHENEAAKIHQLYPTVVAIRSNENSGFSGGNNIGIQVAKGKYIFLINNDYLTLKNLNISYDLPQKWVNALLLQNINIGFSVDNLFILSKQKGFNPQYSFSGGQGAYYVPARVFSFQLSVKF